MKDDLVIWECFNCYILNYRQHCLIDNVNVTVHILEPGAYKTGLMDPENTARLVKATYDRAPSQVREAYGDVYVNACKFERQARNKLGRVN